MSFLAALSYQFDSRDLCTLLNSIGVLPSVPDVSILFTTDYYGLVKPTPVGFVYHYLDALVR